ncbi:NAD(P)H-binding protein [Actinomadura rugatobispora]|uniref:NAD(P)H-binding protein n=1 Tax=Actinomadura rugatobispora TaxID=1994 RepID=A0ABW0ZW96_9ACTN|nr:NmrA family NAD(P)-binding protein [Actinomadura rugatobispora]
MEPILVTGAAGGRQGSTGLLVTRMLLERGHPVRAFVHTDDDRAARLRGLGAEVVAGDLREITSVLPALDGVRRAYFTYPVTEGLLTAAAAFAAAARRQGVERVVEVSQLAADPYAGTPHMRRHWLAEQVFDWAGVGAVHLRAAVFFENLDFLVRAGGRRELPVPLGPPDTVVPLVGAVDVARVATGILTGTGPGPDPVCRLTGQILSVEQIVHAHTAAGTPLTYLRPSPEQWRRQALDLYGDAVTVEHLDHLWQLFRTIGSHHELYEVTPAIGEVGGREPQTLEAFIASRQRP